MSEVVVNAGPGFDTSEPKASIVNLCLILTLGFVGVTFVFSIYLYKSFVTQQLNEKEVTGLSLSLKRTRAYEAETLSSLKWRDKANGGVKIPVEMAKERVYQAYSR